MKTLHKVLVVDDDAVVGRSFDRVLADKGYDVSTALNGKEALNKCSGEEYDVVFTDIKMPGMDGLEVARRIKAKCPWTPVVIITGYGTEENEAEARVLGASGFVRKLEQLRIPTAELADYVGQWLTVKRQTITSKRQSTQMLVCEKRRPAGNIR